MKHAFLILNYNNYTDTINMVNSITFDGDILIVIVDNGSANDSIEVLNSNFGQRDDVVILTSDENLGFAKGNNIGYEYIRKNHPEVDFIHCSNSDIILDDSSILTKVEHLYEEKEFYLMGPKINTHGKSSSPISYYESKESFIKHVKKQRVMVKIYSVIAFFFHKIMGNHLEEIYQNYNAKNVRIRLAEDDTLTPVLSGCYLVVSRPFIEKFDVLFEPITFLYSEEHILTYKLLNLDINNIIYTEEFEVMHMHGGSSFGNNKFKVECELNNLDAMEKMYNNDKEKL